MLFLFSEEPNLKLEYSLFSSHLYQLASKNSYYVTLLNPVQLIQDKSDWAEDPLHWTPLHTEMQIKAMQNAHKAMEAFKQVTSAHCQV